MMYGNCKCFHHVCAKIPALLSWVSAIAFFWTAWKTTVVWNLDETTWFYSTVVFFILAISTKFCGCCWKNYKMMHGHGNMPCPACEGKGGEHTHGNM